MTRYDLFRKRLAPIAFVIALGLVIRHSCQAAERTHATIILDFGDAEPRVRAVDAQLFIDDDVLGDLHRKAIGDLRIGVAKFDVAMPVKDGVLKIDVALDGGVTRRLVRNIHAEEGATITVPLASDLR